MNISFNLIFQNVLLPLELTLDPAEHPHLSTQPRRGDRLTLPTKQRETKSYAHIALRRFIYLITQVKIINCKYCAFSVRSSDSVMLPIRILFHSPQYRTSLSTPGLYIYKSVLSARWIWATIRIPQSHLIRILRTSKSSQPDPIQQ